MLSELKYLILGITIGFVFGFTIMNIPSVMKNSTVYQNLQRQQMIERRK